MTQKEADFMFCTQGKLRDNSESFASISTCDGIQGIFFDGHESFLIDNSLHGARHRHFVTRWRSNEKNIEIITHDGTLFSQTL
jgi:hypothetical protein